ncbi:MAG: hypothetical protein JRH18_13865 [Deltaproteobacteria bacterium]|nr:hypothetical protein [Deltaproteobacteria bacterium]MBW1961403.1 hypothetical protein [Deltaproteobacteria bacterium]MBW2152742.1 hypothetical protein [Deltaproteobacteria bacterium]
MDKISAFPDKPIPEGAGVVSEQFLRLGIKRFVDACQYVHKLPYGYNSDSDDLMILFKEKKGTCTTKHAVIAALAEELSLPITKTIGIYPMTEELVSGTNPILDKYRLPYVPMLHCFLQGDHYRVDLTEGNRNGKNRSIEDFLYTEKVRAGITKREEYLLYRRVLKEVILGRDEMKGVDLKTVLRAREEGLNVLKSNLTP